MKMALLDVGAGKPLQIVDIEDKLSEYYRLIGCDCIDITMRRVGGTDFDVICDDEGLLKDNPTPSMVDANTLQCMLVGNLIFAHHDAEGNMTGLLDGEIEILERAQTMLADLVGEKIIHVILGDYA